MHRSAVHSFVLVGLLGTVVFQAKPPVILRPVQTDKVGPAKPSKEALAKVAALSKEQYLKTNEELRQAWLKLEPEARANLEKSGMKVEDLQKQAQEGVAALARERTSSPAAADPAGATSATWTRVTQLTDQIVTHLNSANPAWRAQANDTVRRMVGNQIWFQPEITPVTAPVAVNSNTVVRHYAPVEGTDYDRINDVFREMQSAAYITQAGTQYGWAFEDAVIRIPANAKTVRVAIRDAWSHSYIRNLVVTGYGSAENKFTISLLGDYDHELASASQSMQHSIFLIGGEFHGPNDSIPSVELNWTRPSDDHAEYVRVCFKLESWAGGGPFGTYADAVYQFHLRAFDVITTS